MLRLEPSLGVDITNEYIQVPCLQEGQQRAVALHPPRSGQRDRDLHAQQVSYPSLCHPNIIPSFAPRIEEQSSLIDFHQYSNLHVQVWNRPGSHRGAREGSYGEGALGPLQSVFILSAFSLMP